MKPLSPADQLFLWLEKRQQPMHVGGLQLFSFPEGAGPKYIAELVESLRAYTQPQGPFSRKLVYRFGQYYWEEDCQFDLEHHFRHEALPKPGRIRELFAHISAEHSNLMDRERPLWEYHLIEGVRGKRFALYTKAHHSMIDGVGAMRMCMRSLAENPDVRDLPPVWAMTPKAKKATHKEDDWLSSLAHLSSGASKQISTIPTLAR
ncbi:MAG: wax ester/triacylglycerol synthase family O-acyltransferase, partial [Pseudomonadales bacterium]|nr:wax ester/triacylglycerol synthase family O-acyltransferase [Pseudomonadales bacterium]